MSLLGPCLRTVAARRLLPAVVSLVAATVLAVPAFAAPASPGQPSTPVPGTPARPTQAPTAAPSPTPAHTQWVMNFETAALKAAADPGSAQVGALRQFTYLELLGYQDEWAHVFDPRSKTEGFIPSDQLGPSDSPPSYLTAPPPATVDLVQMPGRIVGNPSFSYYPTPDPDAQLGVPLAHNAPIFVADTVEGDDGATWYRTDTGDYLPTSAVRLPPPPPRTFRGRWIDVMLTEPATLTAYEGDKIMLTTLVIKGAGKFQTPAGVFSIQRRVEDETMSSDTIGIPRDGPGGYHLEHVLYTQYFLGSGESIHYNYWSSVWGYQGSHGCLGLPYDESKFLWGWATVGTVVSVHY